MLSDDPEEFRRRVDSSLQKHFGRSRLVKKGTFFFDYGNLHEGRFDAGVKEICKNGENTYDGFIWPSYVEDIMGPILFDYGYGPFRWVCLSGKPEDLRKTDKAAMDCIDPNRRSQDYDNWVWIRDAEKNALVVGTQARILYQDAEGRLKIALRFNDMVRKGEIGPVMLGETTTIREASTHPTVRRRTSRTGATSAPTWHPVLRRQRRQGMTLCAIHNGGGVGIGKAINSGFGMLLDGSEQADKVLRSAMMWDVLGGVARRAWARCEHAIEVSREVNRKYKGVTISRYPSSPTEKIVGDTVAA